MDRASQALRRSSVKLRSFSGNEGSLKMVISQLKDLKECTKHMTKSQKLTSEDLLKWSLGEENIAIQDMFYHLTELNNLWTEVQKDFTASLKEFKHQFEMILDEKRQVDDAKSKLNNCENKVKNLQKELQKNSRSLTVEGKQQLESSIDEALLSRNVAQCEVSEKVKENEAVKLIRIKQGLIKLSKSYLGLFHKGHIIYQAQTEIVNQLPEITTDELHKLQFSGSERNKHIVLNAKENIKRYYNEYGNFTCLFLQKEAPPPYSSEPSQNPPYNPHYSGSYNLPSCSSASHCSAFSRNYSCSDERARHNFETVKDTSGAGI